MTHNQFVDRISEISKRYYELDDKMQGVYKEIQTLFELNKSWAEKMIAFNNQILELEKALPGSPDIKRRLDLSDKIAAKVKESQIPLKNLITEGKKAFDRFSHFNNELKNVHENYLNHVNDNPWMDKTLKHISEKFIQAEKDFDFCKTNKEHSYKILQEMKHIFSQIEN